MANKTGKKTPSPKSETPKRAKDSTAKKTNANHWSTAAIVGGVAAVGAAATAALFALRSSSSNSDYEETLIDKGTHAHQADGSDSSASFEAGIADEGTIPA